MEIKYRQAPPALGMLLAIPVSTMPEVARERFASMRLPLRSGVISSATMIFLVNVFVAGAAWRRHFDTAGDAIMTHMGGMAMTSDWMPGNGMLMVTGITLWLSFLFTTIWGWMFMYFFAESLVRIASLGAGQVVGSLPICGAMLLWYHLRRQAEYRRPRRLVADVVERDGADLGLRVETCRDRGWQTDTTLEIDGVRYRVAGFRRLETGARPYVYLLDVAPGWWERETDVKYTPELVLETVAPSK